MKNFILIGAAGYIAPRHLGAIKKTGSHLVAAMDVRDTVGILDSYFPECQFFLDFDKMKSHLSTSHQQVDFVSICSPNSMHFEQIQWALKNDMNVICEKPLVLTTKELDDLEKIERESGRRVYTVLQLRVHDQIKDLKKRMAAAPSQRHQVKLSYITSRGPWYFASWKGDVKKSGGLSTNIGIHLIDMLMWVFGDIQEFQVEIKTPSLERGFLQLANANVEWSLSIDRKQLPKQAIDAGKSTYRHIDIDGEAFEFSEGFTELHNVVYADILSGGGYGIAAARPAIALVEKLRQHPWTKEDQEVELLDDPKQVDN